MSEESVLQDFDRLEQGLDRLIAALDVMKTEKASLAAKIEDLTVRLAEKTAAYDHLVEERSKVREKIDVLLSRLVEP